MNFANSNNVTSEGYDFTESFTDWLSRATLEAALKEGLYESFTGAKAEGRDTHCHFQFTLPCAVFGVVKITDQDRHCLKASVKFFADDVVAAQTENGSFDGHSAIAFLQFDFDLIGRQIVERKLEGASMFVRDGSADQMFVVMKLLEDPQAFAA